MALFRKHEVPRDPGPGFVALDKAEGVADIAVDRSCRHGQELQRGGSARAGPRVSCGTSFPEAEDLNWHWASGGRDAPPRLRPATDAITRSASSRPTGRRRADLA